MPSAISFKYKDEEVESLQDYPADYKPNSVEQQIDILRSRENFPFLNPDPAIRYYRKVYPTLARPDWVEGPFVLLSASTLARDFFIDTIFDMNDIYCHAVRIGMGKLCVSQSFYNALWGKTKPSRLRRKARYAPMYELLYTSQPDSDLIIVGGQYGKYHGGQSMRWACERMQGNELPAGALEGIIMALANPTRYAQFEELDTDLPADEFRSGDEEAEFLLSPFLDCDNDNTLEFNAAAVSVPGDFYGAVSFCVPQ